MKDREFDLYRTAKGPVCVTTLAHRRILNALKEGERSFSEVVDATGKAKSTVSIHLNRMVDQGLVSAREDEEDARRRFFSLEAEPIATADPDLAVDEPEAPDHLDAEGLVVSLLGRLAGAGISVEPLFRQVGRRTGDRLGDAIEGSSTERSAENVANVWSKWGLGDVTVDGTKAKVKPSSIAKTEGFHADELFAGLLESALGRDGLEVVDRTSRSFTVTFED